MPKHFDLTDLCLFQHVAEAGSITAGAIRSGLVLASARARIQGMEAQARVTLLDRGRRGVAPTPAGRAPLHHARLVSGQVERMRGELGDYVRGLKGHVRLLANTSAATVHLAELLATLLRANPNVDVGLDERSGLEVTRAVAEGEADLGVAAGHADLSGLKVMPFRTDRLVLVVPPDHALVDQRRIAFAEALDSEFVGVAGDVALGGYLVGHAARAGGRMRTRLRVRGLDAACHMAVLGAGIAEVPDAAAKEWAERSALTLVPLEDAWAEPHLVIVVQNLEELSFYASRLAEHLATGA